MNMGLATLPADRFSTPERSHQVICDKWGFPDAVDFTMEKRFQAKYQGQRYSFGYLVIHHVQTLKIKKSCSSCFSLKKSASIWQKDSWWNMKHLFQQSVFLTLTLDILMFIKTRTSVIGGLKQVRYRQKTAFLFLSTRLNNTQGKGRSFSFFLWYDTSREIS